MEFSNLWNNHLHNTAYNDETYQCNDTGEVPKQIMNKPIRLKIYHYAFNWSVHVSMPRVCCLQFHNRIHFTIYTIVDKATSGLLVQVEMVRDWLSGFADEDA